MTPEQFEEKWPSRGSITRENFQEFYKDFQQADDDHLRHLNLSVDDADEDDNLRELTIDQLNKIHTIHRRFSEFIEWLKFKVENQNLHTFLNYIDEFEMEYPSYKIRCIISL